MKVVVATPLYPPDIAESATYVKELAKRLTSTARPQKAPLEITIVTYGYLPERVTGVSIVTVNKLQPLVLRLIGYTFALLRAVRSADIIYMQNGASVELPTGIVSRISGMPLVAHMSDKDAHQHARRSTLYGMIEHFALSRARNIIEDTPLERPEILPFRTLPTEELATYEASWNKHLASLEDILAHV